MSHLTRNVFVGGPPGQRQEENSWVLTALHGDETLITHFAAFSVAKAYFARLYEQPWLLTEATQDYGKALQQLNSSLERSTSATFARHLVAMFLLVFYELLCPTSHAGLYYHYSGIETLIHSQSPIFYQTQPNLGYFMQARVLIISGALLSSKKTFLAEHDWKVIPWSGETFKSLYHEIWDHLCDVATLLEEFENLTSTKGKDVAACGLFSNTVDKKIDTIESWRRRWDGQNCGKVLHVGIDWRQTLLPRVDPIANVSSALTYANQQCARESMLYYTALLYLYWMAAKCQTQLQSPATSHVNLERCSSRCGLHHVTWQIILSVDYLMMSSRVKAGMSFLTLAADAMLRCYKSADWLIDMLMRMADISGYGFFRQLLKDHIPHAISAHRLTHL
ncbi:hypothetical protein H2200_010328 [Cladophialophora chaetospira]|uniref:Uncharacterized protein n=1 Tax=Cladophialophora chaetospira TaxID=386627 RepID=A0AA39CE66_9EURO|nr:hypothetical protein H2200_010328 [Cladophialophora chaetospira]